MPLLGAFDRLSTFQELNLTVFLSKVNWTSMQNVINLDISTQEADGDFGAKENTNEKVSFTGVIWQLCS